MNETLVALSYHMLGWLVWLQWSEPGIFILRIRHKGCDFISSLFWATKLSDCCHKSLSFPLWVFFIKTIYAVTTNGKWGAERVGRGQDSLLTSKIFSDVPWVQKMFHYVIESFIPGIHCFQTLLKWWLPTVTHTAVGDCQLRWMVTGTVFFSKELHTPHPVLASLAFIHQVI